MPTDAPANSNDPDQTPVTTPPADYSTHIEQNIREVAPGGQVIGHVDHLTLQQAPAAPPPAIPLELPEPPSRFRARQSELKLLLAGLQPGTIYTLLGPGGIGKTALASKALHSLTDGLTPPQAFPGGVIFHSFYKQPGLDMALSHIARLCGEELQPTPLEAARRALAGRTALLFLDGCEEAENLDALLAIRQRCGVLITSRDPIHLRDAGQTLKPLARRDGLALLADWAEGYASDQDAARRVWEFTGGLTIALRIAGQYMASTQTPVAEYADLLESSRPERVLELGKRRSLSIPALLEHTVARLSNEARDALSVVGLLGFAPFERRLVLDALEISEQAVTYALGELVRFGLLDRLGAHYHAVHRLLHSYARRSLTPPPEALENLARRFTFMAEWQADHGPEGHAMLDADLAHILAVLSGLQSTGDLDMLIYLAFTIQGYLDLHGRWAERLQTCELALAASRLLNDHRQEARWLDFLGITYRTLGEPRRAIDFYLQALEIARQSGDRTNEGYSLGHLGNAYRDLGEPRKAIQYHEQALEIARKEGHRPNEAAHLDDLGLAYTALGEPRKAIEFHQQALEIDRQIGERRGEGADLGNLGLAYAALGEPRRAIEFYQQALEIARQIGDRPKEGSWLGNLGLAYAALGEPHMARDCYQQALEIARQTGYRIVEANTLNNLGIVYSDLGELEQARACYRQSLEIKLAILPPEHPSLRRTQDNLARLPPA